MKPVADPPARFDARRRTGLLVVGGVALAAAVIGTIAISRSSSQAPAPEVCATTEYQGCIERWDYEFREWE